jgi:hypothetical protein
MGAADAKMSGELTAKNSIPQPEVRTVAMTMSWPAAKFIPLVKTRKELSELDSRHFDTATAEDCALYGAERMHNCADEKFQLCGRSSRQHFC